MQAIATSLPGVLASALWKFAGVSEARGTYHWTDAGVASWYDFAQATRDLAQEFLTKAALAQVVPAPTAQYPTSARRPASAVLDKDFTWQCIGNAQHWRTPLSVTVRKLLKIYS